MIGHPLFNRSPNNNKHTMKQIAKSFLALLAIMLLSTTLSAKGTPGTWSGTLIDKHCGGKMATDATKLGAHDKDCTMKCAKNGAGLGMVVDGKWYAFDSKGEKMGWKLLKGSTMTDNMMVTVTGSLNGDKISVKKIMPKV